jgi:alkaline phosphatase
MNMVTNRPAKLAVGILLLGAAALSAASRAKNVILFIGDGTGIPTINAASIYAHGKARALYVQNMPHIGLSETSTTIAWVSDSAAGMTAIVTGHKTKNTVLSQSADAEPGVKDGAPLKTILEYAEEHGLSTGVVSNSAMSDATPAACYAHSNSRRDPGIFAQILKPRFGDGVDVVIGPGRKSILAASEKAGVELNTALPAKGFLFLASLAALDTADAKARRVVALWDGDDFDLGKAVDHAIRILSQNRKGFFLMIESNNHFDSARKSLDNLAKFDKIIQRTADAWRKNTLLLFTADHSYGLRLAGGRKGQDIVPLVKVQDGHTAEEVLVAAEGPGSQRVKGVMENTELFRVMLSAYGWKP